AIAWIVLLITDSVAAAAVGATVFALNPNVLYLQATPMSEPLLFGLMTLAVAMLMSWSTTAVADRQPTPRSWQVGAVFALACLTRYEAWPVMGAALVLAGAASLR